MKHHREDSGWQRSSDLKCRGFRPSPHPPLYNCTASPAGHVRPRSVFSRLHARRLISLSGSPVRWVEQGAGLPAPWVERPGGDRRDACGAVRPMKTAKSDPLLRSCACRASCSAGGPPGSYTPASATLSGCVAFRKRTVENVESGRFEPCRDTPRGRAPRAVATRRPTRRCACGRVRLGRGEAAWGEAGDGAERCEDG